MEEEWIAPVKAASTLPYYLNSAPGPDVIHNREKAAALAKKAADLGCIGLNMHFSFVSPEIIEAAREQNVLTSFWTPSTQAELSVILAGAPNNVTTNRPDIAYKLLGGEN